MYYEYLSIPRHGWSQLIGNIRPSHAKVICPTA